MTFNCFESFIRKIKCEIFVIVASKIGIVSNIVEENHHSGDSIMEMRKSTLHKIGSLSFLLLGLFYFASLLFQMNPKELFANHPATSTLKTQQISHVQGGQVQLQNAIEVEQLELRLVEVEEEEDESSDRDLLFKKLTKQASIDLLATHQFDYTDRLRVQKNCLAQQSTPVDWYVLYEVFRL